MGHGREYLRNKHNSTLKQIFAKPTAPDVRWQEIEMLIVALGGEVSSGRGSRVRFLLNGSIAIFHRPHPSPVTDKGAVVSLREWLESIGVTP
ncbi:type II toxin-antitoxin system HicA family toxin [Enterobacteriaceae bacterium H11S18]|uniref:type II toxin-antitoxin system HicA family toxin n=1 Tax=Dryocola clanedunensis TaxID=2925396 RepID=UPI0022F13D34|nr:type II toxin-antitoxin system HicA family toxin [Dryocola clanedunensis]MCT4713160.1 type II toxin-antitoxin system HicA family toxin [Dryocola clanedunensis]